MIKNSKHEARNSKQIQNPNVQILKTIFALLKYDTQKVHQLGGFVDQDVSFFFQFSKL